MFRRLFDFAALLSTLAEGAFWFCRAEALRDYPKEARAAIAGYTWLPIEFALIPIIWVAVKAGRWMAPSHPRPVLNSQETLRRRYRFLLPPVLCVFLIFGLLFMAVDPLAGPGEPEEKIESFFWLVVWEGALVYNLIARHSIALQLEHISEN